MIRYTRICALLLTSALLGNSIHISGAVKCKPETEKQMRTLFTKLITVSNMYSWKEFSQQASATLAKDAHCKDLAPIFKNLEDSESPTWVGIKLNAYLDRLPKEIDTTVKTLGVLKLKSIIEKKMSIKKPTAKHPHDEL